MDKPPKYGVLVHNKPYRLTINAELAAEIGLNESIMFLQLDYLISISAHEHEATMWTYQSVSVLHEKFFPFWSRSTIFRLIKDLKEKKLIQVKSFNKLVFDKTNWFALDPEGIKKLTSIHLFQNETSIVSNCVNDSVNLTQPCSQNETTIPYTTPETTGKNSAERDEETQQQLFDIPEPPVDNLVQASESEKSLTAAHDGAALSVGQKQTHSEKHKKDYPGSIKKKLAENNPLYSLELEDSHMIEPYKVLCREFIRCEGVKPMGSVLGKWAKGAKELYEACGGNLEERKEPDLSWIQKAVEESRKGKPLTIVWPGALVSFVVSLRSRISTDSTPYYNQEFHAELIT